MKEADTIQKCNPPAKIVAEAILKLIQADKELRDAEAKVPNYTGQWSHEDYVAEEQEEWNIAANDLYDQLLRKMLTYNK